MIFCDHRLTRGKTNNNVGNATNHENPQLPNHLDQNNGVIPLLYSVLTSDTTQVMIIDNIKGITTVANRAGIFNTKHPISYRVIKAATIARTLISGSARLLSRPLMWVHRLYIQASIASFYKVAP